MKKIPFFKNTKDDTHCFQACIKMALSYYCPDEKPSLKYLDRISGHKIGKWTWQGATLLYLAGLNFDIVNIENLDYHIFSKKGERYLKTIWDKQTYTTQSLYSNLKAEQEIAGKLIQSNKINLVNKTATIKDVEEYFSKDYIVMVSINPYTLRKESGYSSHIVVITDIDQRSVKFHDPGLPPIKNNKVNKKLFALSMTPPAKPDTNVIAVRKL